MFLRHATLMRLLAGVTLLCLMETDAVAQVQDSLKRSNTPLVEQLKSAKPGMKEVLSEAEMHKFNNIVETINKRKRFLDQLPANIPGTNNLINLSKSQSPFSGMKDSVMGEFLHYVGNNFGKERVNKLAKSLLVSGDSAGLQKYLGNKLKGFYAIKGKEAFQIPSFESLVDNQFKGAQYSLVRDNTALAPAGWMHHLSASNDMMIMDIPFHFELANLSDTYMPLRYNNLVKVSFDKDAFKGRMQQKLAKYYDLEKYLLNEVDMLSFVKKHFEQELTSQVEGLKSSLVQNPKAMLFSKFSYDELLKLDISQVKEKLMPADMVKGVKEQIGVYEDVLKNRASELSAVQRDSLVKLVTQKTEHLQSLDQLVTKVSGVKEKLAASGLNVNQITRQQQQTNTQTFNRWNQPSTIKEAGSNLLPQNGLQRFFGDISALNIGTFANNKSERSINALISGGLQIEALKKSSLLGGGLGNIKDAGFLKDAGLQSSLTAAVSMQYAQLGKGTTGRKGTTVTVMNANTYSPASLYYEANNLARNIFVGTISKSFSVRKNGTVEAEVSKSATQFRNTASVSPDQAMEQKSALYSYAEDLLQTLSAGVRYQDDWEQIGLTHNAHVAYAGFGYNNPGNPSASKGSLQYDLQLRKYVEKKKGFLQVQVANRNYNYSADGDQRWKNFQVNLQARYRFDRNLTLGGRINQYQLIRKTATGNQKMYVSRKIAAEGQYSSGLFGLHQRSVFSVGLQQFDNVYTQQGGNSSLLLTQWVTSILLQQVQATVSLFYNKELTENKLIGDQLNAETGVGYTIGKKIMMNSSLTYLDNKLAARQLGTRQSINMMILRNCSIGAYIDWRKNLIEPINPYLYGNFRGELTVQYQIK